MGEAGSKVCALDLENYVLPGLFLLLCYFFFWVGGHHQFFWGFYSFEAFDTTDEETSYFLVDFMEVLENCHILVLFILCQLRNDFLDILESSHQKFRGVIFTETDLFGDLKVLWEDFINFVGDFIPGIFWG